MMSSPYPRPGLWPWRVAQTFLYAAVVTAGAWVLISPPLSYDGIGLALTTMWGIMLALGGTVALAGTITARYRLELPGLVLALGGVVVYDYLSWHQTLTGSLGSGPRALLLIALAAYMTSRLVLLIHTEREARRLKELEEGDV